jgi:hypothetical protein
MNKYFKWVSGFAALFFLAGCSDSDNRIPSESLDTQSVFFDMQFTDNGSGTVSVDTQLRFNEPGSITEIYLSGGDQLWASKDANLEDISLGDDLFHGLESLAARVTRLGQAKGDILFLFMTLIFSDDIWYTNVLETGDASTVYYLSFVRSRRTDALNSTVVLPEPFIITAPLPGEEHSRANDILVEWEPSGSESTVQITVRTSCINGSVSLIDVGDEDEIIISDTGSFTIPGGTLTGASGDCSSVVEVRKRRLGTPDPNIGFARIVGNYVRRVAITTTN